MKGAASEDQLNEEIAASDPRPPWRKKRFAVPSMLLTLIFAGLIAAWFSRESIVNNVIAQQLKSYDLPATYRIEKVGGTQQILADLVIGDPKSPDFTAKQAIVTMRYGLYVPQVASVTLVEPRIYGTYRKGVLSFGSLDKVIFAKTGKPPGLPDLRMTLQDGRGLILTDYGPIGLKAEGSGNLKTSFKGILAATAPDLVLPGCAARGATLFGNVTTSAGSPRFEGPLRLASLACEGQQLAIANYAVALDGRLDGALANPAIDARIDGGQSRYGTYGANGLTGTVRAQLQNGMVSGRYSLAARGFASPQALAAVLTAEGQARGTTDFAKFELDGQVEGNGLRLGRQTVAAIAGAMRSGQGTLLAPIAAQIGRALQAETRGSALSADVRFRKDGGQYTLLAPSAELRGGSGARILTVSRFEMASDGKAAPRVAGNIATGGANLPRLSGRMERAGDGAAEFRLAMERYSAGGSSLAIPQMAIRQSGNGALRFAGRIEASGPLPGGSATNLRLPVDGSWVPGGTLAVWNSCTDVAFDELAIANLRFEKRALTLCPPRGRPILANGPGGLRVAAGLARLDLAGYLGKTPLQIASGPVGFAYPGVMTARAIDVALGPPATASRFRISGVEAHLGKDIAGTFTGADIRLAAVPMNLTGASGKWDYTAGKVRVDGAAFTLEDRASPARFVPLVSNDGTLTLVDNVIDARASLRHPRTGRLVTVADIHHSLADGAGYALLDVPGLKFDKSLQPDQLAPKAKGVIANANGTISGKGRIDWNASGKVTSSGTFGTDGFDFAAAFGPVKGASGQIRFIDLLNLTTAPGQKLRVASVNPGIEVLDGEIEFQLRNGQMLAVAGGNWPFMGGRLILRSVDFNFGVSEERRYIFEIVGLDAAQFVQQMGLQNISATGLFDGTVPIVFDAAGNGKIDTGVLISRPPGGNVSYVGELTYKDLTPIANFAFDALKSLDYDQMRIIMEGPLTGEIVTRVQFDGVKQGAGAKSNFITKRLAALPLQFRINIKAQFYQLLGSLKSLYDPAAVRDPRELGLLSSDGTRLLRKSITGEEAQPKVEPKDVIPGEPPIQPKESE